MKFWRRSREEQDLMKINFHLGRVATASRAPGPGRRAARPAT